MYQVGDPSNPLPVDKKFTDIQDAEDYALELCESNRGPVAIWDIDDDCNTLGLAWEGHVFK